MELIYQDNLISKLHLRFSVILKITMIKNKQYFVIRNLFILLGSTLSVMQGALITPALTTIAEHFKDTENIVFLSKLIIAIPPIFIAIFSPIAGTLFEKFGRKKILILSSILYGIAGSSGFFADSIYLILAGRALLGVSIAGLMTGFMIIIGDLFPDKLQMNKFIGLQGALMSFGGVFYLLIGQGMVNVSWNLPFLAYLFSILIAIGLLLFLQETKSNTPAPFDEQVYKENIFKNKFAKIHFTAVGLMITYLMVPTQIPFILSEISGTTNPNVGIFISIWILFSSITSIFYSKIRLKFNYNQAYSISFVLWSFGYFLIFFANNYVFVILGLIFSGIGNGLAIPNVKAQMLDFAGINQRTKQSGLLSMSLYIGQFLSPILVEPFIRFIDIKAPFLVFAVLLFIVGFGISFNKIKNAKDN